MDEHSGGEVYGEGFGAVYASSRYAAFSQRMAKLVLPLIAELKPPGRQLLDLACGAGAGSLVLAKAGYSVTGIDRSEVMLRHAREHAAKHGVTMELGAQDMRAFALPHQVDAVTCLFDALNYVVEEEDLVKVFHSVAKALRPTGVFVFDMNTADGLATRWGTRDVVFTNRAQIFEVNQSRFDSASGINTTTTTVFVREGAGELFRRYTEVHRERGYPVATITRMLQAADFEVASIYGLSDNEAAGHGLQPLTPGAGRVVIAARRTAARSS
jgi:SAM-dependent methyltransferase